MDEVKHRAEFRERIARIIHSRCSDLEWVQAENYYTKLAQDVIERVRQDYLEYLIRNAPMKKGGQYYIILNAFDEEWEKQESRYRFAHE